MPPWASALEASPGYRLAELLSEVVRRGTHLRVGGTEGGGLAEIRHGRRMSRNRRIALGGRRRWQPAYHSPGRSPMTGKTVRQWLPRPGWVRESVLAMDPETGTLRPPRQFYLVALPAVVAPDVNHGLDRVIVVLPVW